MATWTNLDDEIFSQKVLEGFVKILAPLSAFSTNFSPDPAIRGNNVLVPLIGAVTATTFANSYTVCAGSATVITVAMTSHKIASVGQTDLEAAGSSMANLERFAYQQGAGLATLVLQDILSCVTTASSNAGFPLTTSISSTDMSISQIRAVRLAQNQANVPNDPRSLILDCVPYDVLLGVTNFVQAHMYGDRSAIADGVVARALGYDLYEINNLFATSAMGFAAHPAAIGVAMRYLQPQQPSAYNRAQAITDPKTGLTFGLRDHYDPNTGKRYVNMECLYGYSRGITAAGRIIKRLD